MVPFESFDVVVIGGGPAGLTASIYAARLGMKTLILERESLGGRAIQAPEVWNFPGFPDGISGSELTNRMVKQAEAFDTRIALSEEVLDLSLDNTEKTIVTRNSTYRCWAVIIATGTQRKKLLVPGETELLGRGVSYCAVCDGPLFRDKTAALIGSGDEAFEDALNLSVHAKNVIIITHSAKIEAEEALVNECKKKANIEVVKATVKSILGDDIVRAIAVSIPGKGKEMEVPVDGVFISMGGVPVTGLVKKAGVEVDERGCIKVDRRQATSVEGVYAAGDCTCGGMQIATAVGEGAMAAMQAHRYVKKAGIP